MKIFIMVLCLFLSAEALPQDESKATPKTKTAKAKKIKDRTDLGNETKTSSDVKNPERKREKRPSRFRQLMEKSILEIELNSYATQIEAQDKTSGLKMQVFPDVNFGAKGYFRYVANPVHENYAIVGFRRIDINEAPMIGLDDKTVYLINFGVGMRYKLSGFHQYWMFLRRISLKWSLGYDAVPFLRGTGVAGRTMFDTVLVPNTTGDLYCMLYASPVLTFGAQGGLSLYFPTAAQGYKSTMNMQYRGRVYLVWKKSSRFSLEFGVRAMASEQNTDAIDQTQIDMGADFNIYSPLASF